jgi:hypothetical protein
MTKKKNQTRKRAGDGLVAEVFAWHVQGPGFNPQHHKKK